MKDNSLDRIIREKLEKLTPEFRPESWELFEQRLDAEDAGVPEPSDRVIDETAFRRLHQLEKPYRPAHWQQMTVRLDREFVRPEQILRFKVVELTILLLLLLPLWQLLPEGGPVDGTKVGSRKWEVGNRPAGVGRKNSQTSEEWKTDRNEVETPRIGAGKPADADPGILQRSAAAGLPSSGTEAQKPANSTLTSVASIPPAIAGQRLVSPSAPWQSKGLFVPVRPLAPALAPSLESIGSESPLQRPFATAGNTPLASIDPLSTLSPGLLALSVPSPGYPAVPAGRSRHWYFDMFGSLDYNRIFTPADYFLGAKVHEYDRYETGYSGGFSVAYEIGRWEVQSGAIYSYKHYMPIQLQVLGGRFDEGYSEEFLRGVELNVLHIPINLRYNLIQSPDWRVYALSGISIQVATQANYYIDSQGSRRNRSLLEQFIDNGWFEGGTFTENSYLTGNLGLGVERVVNNRWSVFAQPTYQQAVNFFNHGLGPTRDKISTMSVFMGIRVRVER